jgi:PKD repeat protein
MAKNANPKTWNFTGISRATYASNDLDGSGVNIDPIASFNTSANLLVVDVDASASTDPDGTIVSYDWDWGDATANGSGVTAQHTYASAGT